MSDEWDFYPCRVDDRPASIFLNLRYEHGRPASPFNTLYWVRILMLDAADHGMGSAQEAEALYPIEDGLIAAATSLGLVYVGRLRNDGAWQLTFYGTPDQRAALEAVVEEAELGGRELETDCKPDDDWTYYREFLAPDAERRQWMLDRRLLDALDEHGDIHSTPRRVDHWAYFATSASRHAFVDDASREGFALESAPDDAGDPRAFGAQVFRVDPVELEHIHEVAMTLYRLAETHDGSYDGWETSVENEPGG